MPLRDTARGAAIGIEPHEERELVYWAMKYGLSSELALLLHQENVLAVRAEAASSRSGREGDDTVQR